MERPVVVIVDDDADFLEEIGELLSANGYEVKTVSDPRAAVRVIQQTRPDKVLLDLRMDEKEGFEIARELSENPATAGIPVIIMTGYYSEEQLEQLKGSGVVRSFLSKPLVISDVMAKLNEVRGPV
jgi:CheY-like chemotaxis protein